MAHDRVQQVTIELRAFDDPAEAAVFVSELENRFGDHADVDVEAFLFDSVEDFLRTFPRYAPR